MNRQFAAVAIVICSAVAAIGGELPAPSLAGQVPLVASGLDVAQLLGPKRVPSSAAPDVVGAFRFICAPGQISFDDPIVYPGQPGKAHLHQFFGNLGANADSTYASLRSSGGSTCMNALNRSAYWMPAMLDGRGHAVRPDFVSIYYKRRPASDPFCTRQAKGCVGIPRGLRLIFGWDQFRPSDPQPANAASFNFKCVADGHGIAGVTRESPTLVDPTRVCKPGQQIAATIHTPLCWDGVHLDSPDHRSHVVDMVGPGYPGHCPANHPKLLPQFTMGVQWTIEPGDDPTLWRLSSDHMKSGGAAGATFHSDYFEAWEEGIRQRWQAACLDKLLNCSDGDLGDGQILVRGPFYPTGRAKPRLVPIPRY